MVDSQKILNLLENEGIDNLLIETSNSIRLSKVGNKVYFRALIEITNICNKNCYYCGLRKDNKLIKRYMLTEEKIINLVINLYKQGIKSFAFQSGEINNEKFILKLVKIIQKIKNETKQIDIQNNEEIKGAGITGSFGELEKEFYEELFKAGIHRYLLRIETSNRKLYEKIHPLNHSFNKRLKCLEYLKEIGYQVGSGIMIGIPGQTYKDLIKDLKFFKNFDLDMIGMGPYIEHYNTPIFNQYKALITSKNFYKKIFELSIKMIALTRIILEDVNIVNSTSLQSLPNFNNAFELGIKAGANVVMPIFTPNIQKAKYEIYNLKKYLTFTDISNRIKKINFIPIYNKWGDPLHYFKRTRQINCINRKNELFTLKATIPEFL